MQGDTLSVSFIFNDNTLFPVFTELNEEANISVK